MKAKVVTKIVVGSSAGETSRALFGSRGGFDDQSYADSRRAQSTQVKKVFKVFKPAKVSYAKKLR